MTIDEAIKHQRDMAEEYKFQLVLNETGHPMYALGDREIPRIKQYVEEYTQVAEWLEELKTLREYRNRVEWVIKTQRMIKAEVIDECKKIATADCTSSCEYPFQPDCIECMCNKFDKLKEQDNEQHLCPGGYDKRKVSCDNCEIPFCDYR